MHLEAITVLRRAGAFLTTLSITALASTAFAQSPTAPSPSEFQSLPPTGFSL